MINDSAFCALSNTRSWYQWLHEYDSDLYKNFVIAMRASSGCQDNKRIMMAVHKAIADRGDLKLLIEYLRLNHPSALDKVRDDFWPDYRPGLLSYPRRIIFYEGNYDKIVRDFCSDKLICDYAVLNGKLYIEYLMSSDYNVLSYIKEGSFTLRDCKNEL